MFERIQKLLDRIESRVSLYFLAAGPGALAVGGISAWLASATDWINQYGPIGWWFSALLGVLCAVLIAGGAVWLRLQWIITKATRKWGEVVDSINPLQPEYNKLRISLNDLVHPITRKISGKRFIDCELMGPANILALNGAMSGVSFGHCDVIVLKSALAANKIHNIIVLDGVNIIGGSLWRCTFFIAPEQVDKFREMGADFLSLTGDPSIDTR